MSAQHHHDDTRRNRHAARLSSPKAAATATVAWWGVGVVIAVVVRVPAPCELSADTVRGWPWPLLYGAATFGLLLWSVRLLDLLPDKQVAVSRSICIVGGLLALVFAAIEIGLWGTGLSCGE